MKSLRGIAIALVLAAAGLAASPAQASDPEEVEEALDVYWSEREMPVIAGEQLYTVAERLEFTVFGGIIPNDPFTNYFPVGLRTNYSFDGIFGAGLDFAFMSPPGGRVLQADSELTTFLEDQGAGIRRDVDLGDNQLMRIDLVGTFSPLYGKWSFQTYKISHFDLFLVAGLGVVIVDEPEIREGQQDPEPEAVTAVHFEGQFGAGFRFWVQDWMALRFDTRWYFYTNFEDEIQAPAEITFGLSFLTPR